MKKIKCLFIGCLLITFFIQAHAQNSKYWEEVAKKREEKERKKEEIRKARYAAEMEWNQKHSNALEKQRRCNTQCKEKFPITGPGQGSNLSPQLSCGFGCDRDQSEEYIKAQTVYLDLLYKLRKQEEKEDL